MERYRKKTVNRSSPDGYFITTEQFEVTLCVWVLCIWNFDVRKIALSWKCAPLRFYKCLFLICSCKVTDTYHCELKGTSRCHCQRFFAVSFSKLMCLKDSVVWWCFLFCHSSVVVWTCYPFSALVYYSWKNAIVWSLVTVQVLILVNYHTCCLRKNADEFSHLPSCIQSCIVKFILFWWSTYFSLLRLLVEFLTTF